MVTKNEVLKILELARLDPESEDLGRLAQDFNSILEYVQLLETLDVAQVEPMSHVHGVTNVFRDDSTGQGLDHDAALANAPDVFENFFRVPLVIDSNDK